MVPLGWSVGNLIGRAGVIVKVVKALRKHGGTEGGYKTVSLKVGEFGRLIEDVESLEANELNSNHISVIIEYFSCAKAALEKFLEKILNYEAFLGEEVQVSALADWIRGIKKKVTWPLLKCKRIEEMRDAVRRAEASINMKLLFIVKQGIFCSVQDRDADTITNETSKFLRLIMKEIKNALN